MPAASQISTPWKAACAKHGHTSTSIQMAQFDLPSMDTKHMTCTPGTANDDALMNGIATHGDAKLEIEVARQARPFQFNC